MEKRRGCDVSHLAGLKELRLGLSLKIAVAGPEWDQRIPIKVTSDRSKCLYGTTNSCSDGKTSGYLDWEANSLLGVRGASSND